MCMEIKEGMVLKIIDTDPGRWASQPVIIDAEVVEISNNYIRFSFKYDVARTLRLTHDNEVVAGGNPNFPWRILTKENYKITKAKIDKSKDALPW